MRVLLSAGMIQGGRSGVGRYVIELARAIQSEHLEIELLILGFEADRALFSFVDDAQFIPIPSKYSSGLINLVWHQTRLPRIARDHKATVVHIPSYRRLSATLRCPQVATIHDCAPFVLKDKYDGMRGLMGRGWAPWVARKHCAQVIGVSQMTVEDIHKYMRVSKNKTRCIYNGIDHDKFHPCSESQHAEIIKKHNLSNKFFFYLARIEHPGKNHTMLIEAFENMVNATGDREIQLVCAGSDWHGAEIVHQRVKDASCSEQIRMLGFVDDSDIPACYSAAHATLFPSLYEGFGFPVIESLACGTPVISSDSGSLAEIGAEHVTRCSATDPAAWTQSMIDIASTAKQSTPEAVKYAAQFNWAQCAADTVDVYKQAT